MAVENWDPVLIFILMKKLDPSTHNLYEQSVKRPRELQSLQDFLEFLELRFQALEAIAGKGSSRACLNTTRTIIKCLACKGRYSTNCSAETCKTCNRKHHTSIHDYYESMPKHEFKRLPDNNSKPLAVDKERPSTSQAAASLTTSIPNDTKKNYGLVGTALLSLKAATGQWIEFRALLDAGSQINIMTTRVDRKLGLTHLASAVTINGVGLSCKTTKNRVFTEIGSKINNFNSSIEAHTMQTIVANQPSINFDINNWPIPNGIKLADPKFNKPGPIDVLIGVELYYDIVQIKQLSLGRNWPILQKTVFGWMAAGKVENPNTSSMSTCAVLTNDVEMDLQRFWELEEVPNETKGQTMEEQQCEEYFNRTILRTSEFRFIVQLPFKDDPNLLGQSREPARQRFLSMKRKLNMNQELKKDYVNFMKEYFELGHMIEINPEDIQHPSYFLPHHGVVRPESCTTKLRVVFDASAATTKSVSLNDLLSKEPTIQGDLFTILLRFRLFIYVFTADIEKMYRQILVNQLIFWRSDDQKPLKTYQLNTVTYGTTSAPYLAIKCLQHLAHIEENNHPTASKILRRDFYVDDVMSGINTITEALHAQRDLIQLLQKGGFKLRKWCGNHPKLIENINYVGEAINLEFNSMENHHIKTLGQVWIPTRDEFQIQISMVKHEKCTKRMVSSDISRIFDPLGLLTPVTVEAKLFLQHLWELKLDWDNKLPEHLRIKWERYMENLNCLNKIKVQRHVFSNEVPCAVQLHAFADASECYNQKKRMFLVIKDVLLHFEDEHQI